MAEQRQPLSYYLELSYPYNVVPGESSFFVKFPDLPGCMTQVEHAGEIAAMAEEIRALWIEAEYDQGASIPEPAIQSEFSGKFMTRIPRSLHKELVAAAQVQGASLNAYVGTLLAERNVASRLDARMDRLEAQLTTLNERIPYDVDVERPMHPAKPGITGLRLSSLDVFSRDAVAY